MNRLPCLLITIAISALGACGPSSESPASPDFAILARAADGYAQAEKGKTLQFPQDHGRHPDFRIEWWYLTANLQDAEGQPYGAQWTLFRTAVRPTGGRESGEDWQNSQVFMAHFALTWPGGHRAFQRYARGGDDSAESRAGVSVEPFSAWLDDWTLHSTGSSWLPLKTLARQDNYALKLNLDSNKPLVLQGDAGFSQKHPQGGGSHYYSQPFLQANGELHIDGETIPVSGQAWLDHEWSSQFLQADQAGWDWFAVHLDNGEKLMMFRLRQREGYPSSHYQHGVLISAEGDSFLLDPARIGFHVLSTNKIAGRELPLHWRIDLPEIGRSLDIEALHPDQWMDVDFPYWEGAVIVTGEEPGVRGVGYVELIGYGDD